MSKYPIPKEIKSKPKLLGIYLKHLFFLVIGIVLTISVLSNMVHESLKIPFNIVIIGALLYAVMPSSNNHDKTNYESVYLMVKRDRMNYHSIENNLAENQELLMSIKEGDKHGTKKS